MLKNKIREVKIAVTKGTAIFLKERDMKFDYREVQNAYERIKDYISPTPLIKSFYLGNGRQEVFFKLESMQIAKSFKIRGALNKMLTLSEEEKQKGVATISSGNHGSSVAYVSQLIGIKKAIIIVPENTPQSKIDKIKYFGATPMLMGANYDEAYKLGKEYIAQNEMTYIDGFYDDEKVYAGHGTIATEIFNQNPKVDTIVVPIGGGGLITGIAVEAKHINPNVKIIGVQTEACPAMVKAYEDNVHYVDYPTTETICDSLVGGVGLLSYNTLRDYLDDILVVSEENIAESVAFMAYKEKIVAEPGSCTTIAALKEYPEKFSGENIALVITGGNIDEKLFFNLLEKYKG